MVTYLPYSQRSNLAVCSYPPPVLPQRRDDLIFANVI
jgi:hypothetical protein